MLGSSITLGRLGCIYIAGLAFLLKSVFIYVVFIDADAAAATPASLTDFPGGRPAGLTKAEALAGMTDGREMLDNMASMTPEQIEDLLNRLG